MGAQYFGQHSQPAGGDWSPWSWRGPDPGTWGSRQQTRQPRACPTSPLLMLPAVFQKDGGPTEWADTQGDGGRTISPGDPRVAWFTPLQGTAWNEGLLSPSTWEGGANDGALGPAAALRQMHVTPRARTPPWHCLAPQRASQLLGTEALLPPNVRGSVLCPDEVIMWP